MVIDKKLDPHAHSARRIWREIQEKYKRIGDPKSVNPVGVESSGKRGKNGKRSFLGITIAPNTSKLGKNKSLKSTSSNQSKTPQTSKGTFTSAHSSKKVSFVPVLIGIVILLLLAIGVVLTLPSPPIAVFVDTGGTYLQGFVYLDSDYIGEVTLNSFDEIPKIICTGTHTLTLESDSDSFDWQTFPVDCKVKRIIFNVTKTSPRASQNIVFKFVDDGQGFSMAGDVYFDDTYLGNLVAPYAMARSECANYALVYYERDDFNVTWNLDPALCYSESEIEFRIGS